MENFQKALETNGLSNLGWKGQKLMWSNKNEMKLLSRKGLIGKQQTKNGGK